MIKVNKEQPIFTINGRQIKPSKSIYRDIYELGNHLQLQINAISDSKIGVIPGDEKHTLVMEQQTVELTDIPDNGNDQPVRGPAGPVGHVDRTLPFLAIIVIIIGIVGILVAFGQYFERIDRKY